MKKVLALALALIMMLAIAIPAFAATGESGTSVFGDSLNAAEDNVTVNDKVEVEYGVLQAYEITIPADVNFGYADTTVHGYSTTRDIKADKIVIAGNEWLVVTVASANNWQMVDANKDASDNPISDNVDYTATLADMTTAADDTITFSNTNNTKDTVLVVAAADGNKGYEDAKKATGTNTITFATAGTAQEGRFLDTLTFSVEITTTNPVA